jgi:phage tail-like protein
LPENALSEFIPFRFRVTLSEAGEGGHVLCRGAFSEVSGLEASMAPKTYKEGGRNWGEVQLSGLTTFPPVVLKRGVTDVNDLWIWFETTTRASNHALRYLGKVEVFHPHRGHDSNPLLVWNLDNVLPTKFKGPDLSATASQVAIEELHLVHEGLTLERNPAQ